MTFSLTFESLLSLFALSRTYFFIYSDFQSLFHGPKHLLEMKILQLNHLNLELADCGTVFQRAC